MGFSFDFPATQTHIADRPGLTSVHVNRTLQVLKKEEVVTVESRTAHVLDWTRLIRIGDFEPAYLQIARLAREPQPVAVAAAGANDRIHAEHLVTG